MVKEYHYLLEVAEQMAGENVFVSRGSDVGCKRICQVLIGPHPAAPGLRRIHECPLRVEAQLGWGVAERSAGDLNTKLMAFGIWQGRRGHFLENTERSHFKKEISGACLPG